MDNNFPQWQIINVKNLESSQNNAIIFMMSHSLADGIRIGEFFQNWLKFEDGSDAYIEVLQKMKMNTTLTPNANLSVVKMITN